MTDGLARGGKERQLCFLTKYLLNKNYQIKIVSAKKISAENYLNEYNIPRALIIELNTKKYIKGFLQIKDIFKHFKPDVILCWDTRSAILGAYFKNKTTVINNSLRRGTFLNLKHLIFSKIASKLCRFNLANSIAALTMLNLPINQNNRIIYNGIDLNKKYDNKKHRDVLFQSVFNQKYTEDKILFLSIANLFPHKDYKTIIEAFSNLENQNNYYIIIGDGTDYSKIMELIEKKKLKNNIKLVGSVENVDEYLSAVDVFIHSSSGEGCSNAILEAMKYNLPLITTDNGGTKEIVFFPATSFFKYKNIDGLALCIKNSNQLISKTNNYKQKYIEHIQQFNFTNVFFNIENFLINSTRNNESTETKNHL
jgi:glycosyltransferase involved in cell wall biosynthesis